MMKKTLVLAATALMLVGFNQSALSSEKKATPPEKPVAAAPAAATIKGKVAETMDSGGYTYLLLKNDGGEQWVAIPQAKVEVGKEIEVVSGMTMANFQSKTLNRTFESVVFSTGLVGASGSFNPHAKAMGGAMGGGKAKTGGSSFNEALKSEAMQNKTGMPVPQMGGSSGSLGNIVPSADLSVPKAEGDNGYTVGDAFTKAKELDQKKIKVRGKIMKVSKMIMGKNWIHIQDGTGDPLNNSHDLVVTTMSLPKKGDTVIVEGVLHADRDFGAGYKYAAIIEDAEVTTE